MPSLRHPLRNADPGTGSAPGTGIDYKAMAEASAKRIADIEAELLAAKDKLKTVPAVTPEELKRLADAEKELTMLKASSKPEGGIDLEQLLKRAVEVGRAEGTKEVAPLTARIQELEASKKAAELRELRERLVKEAGGESEMIIELVHGTDEATLKDSIAKAQAIYKRTLGAVKTSTETTQQPAQGQQQPPANPPANTPQTTGETFEQRIAKATKLEDIGDIRKLSPSEYAAAQKRLVELTRGRYAPAV